MNEPIRELIPDVRYYWHGDQHESESRLLYDRPSDAFVAWNTFPLTEDSEYAYRVQDALNFVPRGYTRPADAPNIFGHEPPMVSTELTALPVIESRNSREHWRYPPEFWCCGNWDKAIEEGFERSLLYFGDSEPIGVVLRAASRGAFDRFADACDVDDSRLRCKQWRKTSMQAALSLRSQLHADDARLSNEHRPIGGVTLAFHDGQPCFLWRLRSQHFAGIVVIVEADRWTAERCRRESCAACSSAHTVRLPPTGWVYFFRDTSGRIKIGTTITIPKRFGNIQTASAENIIMIAKIPGGKQVETMLHERFKADRTRGDGEWFMPSKDLLTMIKQLKGGD